MTTTTTPSTATLFSHFTALECPCYVLSDYQQEIFTSKRIKNNTETE